MLLSLAFNVQSYSFTEGEVEHSVALESPGIREKTASWSIFSPLSSGMDFSQ